MMPMLTSLWTTYNEMLKSNPIVSGAVTLYGMGIVTYVFRSIPMRIYHFVKRQFMVSAIIHNNDPLFDYFTQWLEKNGRVFRCKDFSAKAVHCADRGHVVHISIGYGNHMFFYKRRVFFIGRIEKDANNTTDTKESIVIHTFGWHPHSIKNLLQDLIPIPRKDALTHVHEYENYWRGTYSCDKRNLDSVVLTDENSKKLKDHIGQYLKSRDWYKKYKIPYRTGIVLEGPPGTGKTTLSMALCGEFDCNLFIVNLSTMSDGKLMAMFRDLPPKAIVLIEDIDSYSVTNKRGGKTAKRKKKKDTDPGTPQAIDGAEDGKSIADLFDVGSLSGLLNAIDGICSSEDRILIATTNHLEKLDPALIRPGRFELILKIDDMTDETATKMFAKFYPDFKVPSNFKMRAGVSPATFQTLAIGNKDAPEKLLEFCQEREETWVAQMGASV